MLTQIVNQNICQSCGACCAHFRVSFYWAEAEKIPEHMIEQLTPIYSCMKGTNQPQAYCVALSGQIGEQVSCRVYAERSSTCKEVQMGDMQCNKARQAHGFIPVIYIEEHQVENDPDFHQVG